MTNQYKGALQNQIKNAGGRITKLEAKEVQDQREETESQKINNEQMRQIENLEHSEEHQDKKLEKLQTRTVNMMDSFFDLQTVDKKLQEEVTATRHR